MWEIREYAEDGWGWFIYNMKTDAVVCGSPVRETLETILELLAMCEAQQAVGLILKAKQLRDAALRQPELL